MKLALIAGSASLLALLLVAPGAQAASQLRHFQGDLSQVGAPPRDGGQIGFDVVFKNKRGAKRKFTPRQIVSVETEKMPLSCTNSPGQGGAEAILTTTIQTQVNVTKQPPPVSNSVYVKASHVILGKQVVVTASAGDALSIDVHAIVQVGAECAP